MTGSKLWLTLSSVSGAIWRSNLVPKLTAYLPTAAKGQANAIFGSIVVAQKYAAGTAERVAIDQAYRETQKLLAIAATCALSPMIIAMWFIKNVELTDEERVEKEARRASQESETLSHTTEQVVGNGPEKV